MLSNAECDIHNVAFFLSLQIWKKKKKIISFYESTVHRTLQAAEVELSESYVWPRVDLWPAGPRAKGGKTPNFLCPFRPELGPDVLFE